MGVTTTTTSAATYVPIATLNGTGSSNTISFTSIPSTYTDLVLVCNLFSVPTVNTYLSVNGSGSGYSHTIFNGTGSSATPGRNTSESQWNISDGSLGSGSSTAPFLLKFNFMNYANTNIAKTVLGRQNLVGATYNGNGMVSYLWNNTTAINRIDVVLQTGNNFTTNSIATLYGIKAA